MDILIIIVAYLAVGVLLNFVGPMAKGLNKEMSMAGKSSADEDGGRKFNKDRFVFEFSIRFMYVAFFPLVYLIYAYNCLKFRKNKR